MNDQKSITSDPKAFPEIIIKKLGDYKTNYLGRHNEISEHEKKGERYFTSGVILLIHFLKDEGKYRFILTKRSDKVVQPGDLSCPGGHLSKIDKFHSYFIIKGLSPFAKGLGIEAGKKLHSRQEFKIVAKYLACALRETAEEAGFSRCDIDYLGPLPPYSLMSFNRVIFPTVGEISGDLKERLNWEVEKIVPIDVNEMFNPKNYYWVDFEVPGDIKKASNREQWKFPAFVINYDGKQEILWGATFNIILTFLWIVFNFTMPEISVERVVRKEIPENYFTGGFKKVLKDGFEKEKNK
jgi:8-oxo-dGTP pyrophosphatase MutT (NUDIX family)